MHVDLDPAALLGDLVSAGAAYGLGELAKRLARGRGRPVARAIRRAIPLLAVVTGAGVRAGLEALVAGGPVLEAAIRGAASGAFAVYGHELRRRTVAGDVRELEDARERGEQAS